MHAQILVNPQSSLQFMEVVSQAAQGVGILFVLFLKMK